MSVANNERPVTGTRLTRAMHRAAAALYAAGFEREREEPYELVRPSEPVHAPSQLAKEELPAASNAPVPDLPPVLHSEGGSTDATEGALQGQSEGVSDSSGTTQR